MSNVTEVVMPLMGEGVHEATLTNWLIKEGSKIEKDSPLLELSTDKVDTEIPSPASGYLVKIVCTVGTVVKVGQVLAHIAASPDAVVSGGDAKAAPTAKAAAAPAASAAQSAKVETTDDDSPLRSSPLVRKIAADKGIDLNQIQGSGMHGRITKKDILDFAENPAAAPSAAPAAATRVAVQTSAHTSSASQLSTQVVSGQEMLEGVPVRREPMSRMRQLIADHMVESVRVSPHVTTVFEMDLHKIWQIRDKYKDSFYKAEGFKLTLTHFFIHAAIQAIKQHPVVNTSVDGYDILWKKDINVGCAVALENGLIVPVIKNAGDLNLLGVARRLNDLIVRAKSKKLKAEDVQGGTFTITNPGGWGSITSNPIINQPQVAILGIGAAVKRPVVVDDMIAIRPMMMMSLTFDHRAIDGEGGAKYLATLKEIIENYKDLPL
ncbi:MAG: 2-oxo acid dehydrogenase subunit E2 [Proteobacteria bacterium]|nr:MAG: 2-oxo acid dehydrogenase subunit E2 [Pseudomonadota bacterium]